jgi:hypothetical protein
MLINYVPVICEIFFYILIYIVDNLFFRLLFLLLIFASVNN